MGLGLSGIDVYLIDARLWTRVSGSSLPGIVAFLDAAQSLDFEAPPVIGGSFGGESATAGASILIAERPEFAVSDPDYVGREVTFVSFIYGRERAFGNGGVSQ